MLDKFLDGKLAVYIPKGLGQNIEMVAKFCSLIEPYIKSWAFNGMSLRDYLASEKSGPCHFVVHRTHVNGGTEWYIRSNNIGRIILLSEFLSEVSEFLSETTKPEISNDEYYDVLFGA